VSASEFALLQIIGAMAPARKPAGNFMRRGGLHLMRRTSQTSVRPVESRKIAF
jgi:hypothetical protein